MTLLSLLLLYPWALTRRVHPYRLPEMGPSTPPDLRYAVEKLAAGTVLPIPNPVSTLELFFWGSLRVGPQRRLRLLDTVGWADGEYPWSEWSHALPTWRLAQRYALQVAGSRRRWSSRD